MADGSTRKTYNRDKITSVAKEYHVQDSARRESIVNLDWGPPKSRVRARQESYEMPFFKKCPEARNIGGRWEGGGGQRSAG